MTNKTLSAHRDSIRSSDVAKVLSAPQSAVASDHPGRHRSGGSGTSDSDEFRASRACAYGLDVEKTPNNHELEHESGNQCPKRPPRRPGHPRAVRPRKDRSRKVHSLIDKVYDWTNLYWAWRRVRRNRGAHGIDNMSLHMFESNWETHLREIQRHLQQRRYIPKPVRRVYIPKSSDPAKLRPLGIPVVKDRIVQQALVQLVDPIFDGEMSQRSFGFRKGRNQHAAIATVLRDAKDGYQFVLDADIASFFDRTDHDVVMSRVRARIADGRVLQLIEAFLKAGVWEDGKLTVPPRGLPQGGVISPWLSNLVLDDLDKALEARGFRHVRFADDFVVLCKSPEESKLALAFVTEVLDSLKLSLHETKTRLTDFHRGFEFLGFRFRAHRLGIPDRVIDKFKDRVRHVTRRQQGRNVEAVLQFLNPILTGWARYYGVAQVKTLFHWLDQWIRMRIRAFRLKRRCRHDNWRLPNAKLAKWGLLSLLQCRPAFRLSYVLGLCDQTRAGHGSLLRGTHTGSPSALTAHAAQCLGP